MAKIAAVDIGTNTALLLVAEVTKQNEIIPIAQEEKIVRLGQGVDRNKYLNSEAIGRTLMAIREQVKIAENLGAEKILISGTSAVRDAANREILLSEIENNFGITMQVLSGDEEAELTYFGALSNKTLRGDILLVDIGGGSTEFIFGTQQKIKYVFSLNIGSVRLTERFVQNDPITETEYKSIRRAVKEQLSSLKGFDTGQLMGIAGTVTTLAAMHLQMNIYDSSKIDNSLLRISQTKKIVSDLKKKTLSQRRKFPGLKHERADVILAGALILLEVMQHFKFNETLVSDRGVRFGLILQELGMINA